MHLRGVSIAVVLLLVALPLAPLPAGAAPHRRGIAAEEGVVGIIGEVQAPEGARVVRLGQDFDRDDLSEVDQLVIDRATYEKAKENREQARALNWYAARRPLTVDDARPEDLNLARGRDLPSGLAVHHATTVLRAGGVTYEGVHAWDHEPGADVVRTAQDWWEETKERNRGEYTVAAESYSGSEWSLRYSTSYTYSTYPYGVLKYRGDWYKSIKETTPHYDLWAVVFDTITDPGVSTWGTAWRTDQTYITSDIDYYRFDHVIVDSEPSTRYNVNWISYSAGFTSYYPGGPSYISNTYYSGYAVDPSDYSYYWNYDSFFQVSHRFDYGSGPASGGYTSEPAVVIQVNQGSCLKIPFQTRAAWRFYASGGNDQWTESWIDSWREVC